LGEPAYQLISTFNNQHAGERITTLLNKCMEIQVLKIGSLFPVIEIFHCFVMKISWQG